MTSSTHGTCAQRFVRSPGMTSRGRYTALWLTTSQLGFTLGPAIGGLLLAHSAKLLWLVSAGVCVACSAAAVFLGRFARSIVIAQAPSGERDEDILERRFSLR